MSSKIGQSQPHGRRTPLSLTSKHAQQQQNSKSNSNSSKTLDSKSEAVTKNGNTNSGKNQETNHLTQKELKKVAAAAVAAQQNGNGNSKADDDDDVIIISDEVVVENTKNGSANGHKNDKSSGPKTEANVEKGNEGNFKDKSKKQQETDPAKLNEDKKKQNESAEKSIVDTQTMPKTKASKPNDDTATTTAEDDKKQATKSNEIVQIKTATPTKTNEKSKTNQTPPASKSGTPSKSPRAGKANKSANSVSEPAPVDVEMLPLVVDPSPTKTAKLICPAATSTPGKASQSAKQPKAEAQNNQKANKSAGASPEHSLTNIPRVFSQISGRRSIRQLNEYTPNMYNSKFRESYRRINTELDVTGNTNTSMNVTVGSEVPNNSSFLSLSFLGRGRKRERTPPPATPGKSQSTVELSTTPPKKARLDMQGILTAVASPLTMLRSRFSKTTLVESSTPAKAKVGADTEDDVQNVSGVSIEEVVGKTATEHKAQEANVSVGEEATIAKAEKTPKNKSSPAKAKNADNKEEKLDVIDIGKNVVESKDAADTAMDVDNNINIKETPLISAEGDPNKQRGCAIM